MNGSIEDITDDNGKTIGYRARWRDPDGAQKKKKFRLKKEAADHLADMASSKSRGQYIDVTDKTTVAEYARRWLEARPYRVSSRQRRDGHLQHIDGTRLGGLRLQAVRRSDVQAWATERSKVLGPSTTRDVLSLLRSVMAAAAEDRLIGFSPATGKFALPPSDREPVHPLTISQVRKLAEAIDAEFSAVVVVQAGTGLRIGELLALRLIDVDFLRREVRVREQLHPRSRERIPTKTPDSVRVVPMPEVVSSELARHLAAHPASDQGYLFTDGRGLPRQHQAYSVRVTKAAARAGLPPTTTHDLRHHYASVLLEAGESVVTVAARLGHKNANLVIKVYGHLMPNSEQRTRKAIDAAWCAPDVPSSASTAL